MSANDGWIEVTPKKKKQQQRLEFVNKKTPKPDCLTPHPLNDTWVCWFHDVNNDSWQMDSFIQLLEFNTAEDFWILQNNLTNINNGMYFLMRRGFPPIWDHELNRNGGGWTFKVDKKNSNEFWQRSHVLQSEKH